MTTKDIMTSPPTAYIKAGWGFNVGYDFARATVDTPIWIDTTADCRKSHVVGFIRGDAASKLGFLRPDRVRVCTDRRAIGRY